MDQFTPLNINYFTNAFVNRMLVQSYTDLRIQMLAIKDDCVETKIARLTRYTEMDTGELPRKH